MPNKIATPTNVREAIAVLAGGDRNLQGEAYSTLLEATKEEVGWADEVWRDFVELLGHRDNRVRSIAGQMLCNLARSASEETVMGGLDALEGATRDEKFVTARHVLEGIWKVGLGGGPLRGEVVRRLEARFRGCSGEKNGTLVRHDILVCLRRLFDATGDEGVKETALGLIPLEEDLKYRKKYAGAWRGAK